MFLSRNKKNNVYTCKPQFYHSKVGFKGSKLYRYVSFRDDCLVVPRFFVVFLDTKSVSRSFEDKLTS